MNRTSSSAMSRLPHILPHVVIVKEFSPTKRFQMIGNTHESIEDPRFTSASLHGAGNESWIQTRAVPKITLGESPAEPLVQLRVDNTIVFTMKTTKITKTRKGWKLHGYFGQAVRGFLAALYICVKCTTSMSGKQKDVKRTIYLFTMRRNDRCLHARTRTKMPRFHRYV